MQHGRISQLICSDLPGYGGRFFWPRILYMLLMRRENWSAIILARLIPYFHRTRNRALLRWASKKLRAEFGCFVQPGAEIGPGLKLPHPNGIIIGSGVRIGARCTIYHQVTFGAARRGEGFGDSYPQVGDDVTIFAGAKLVGPIKIGDGAVIGANAVVLRDVPAAHRATGVPAVASPLRPPQA